MNSYLLIDALLFIIFGFLLYLLMLPYLKKLKFGQNIRSDGPSRHLQKKGTPTMGGIIILICCLVFMSLLLIEFKEKLKIDLSKFLLLFIPMFVYGILGLIDDILIVVKHKNDGIKPSIKFLIQLLLAVGIYFSYLSIYQSNEINFFGIIVDIKFMYGMLIIFLLVGVTNATNLTDGIDGLLAGCAIISYLSFGILGIYKNETSVIIFSFAMCIALSSFLCFNLPKASVFMGNVGSLLIGAGLVMESIILKMEILLFFIGFVYLLETVSVIVQVWFYKKTKGERLFKMSPFHHHLELSGFKEMEIDIMMYGLQIIMSAIGVLIGIMVF